MKLLCALVGHKWSETYTGEGALRCRRCGATHELVGRDDAPPNYRQMARTTTYDQQANIHYGGLDE